MKNRCPDYPSIRLSLCALELLFEQSFLPRSELFMYAMRRSHNSTTNHLLSTMCILLAGEQIFLSLDQVFYTGLPSFHAVISKIARTTPNGLAT